MMALLTVGIGDCKVSNDPDDTIVTHALGSCIAIMLYDPVAKVAGLLHFMLPDSAIDCDRATKRPFLFADTGIPLLLEHARQLGAVKSRSVVMAAGGAHVLDPNGTFNIGQRNHLAMRKICRNAGIVVHKEDIGGTSSRSVRVSVSNGRVQLTTSGKIEQDLVVDSKTIGADNGLPHTHSR
jgi:chemotaxis protein CheD